ncbi:c-type cytochrome [Marinobacterium marinum]|uniref:Cytochrome c n=1 Tax=Marinobacterium marinum TaxID=2756129 RepID=A0A7W1X031_9GAMM|nr:cytochrome c [Marinobacterium marinum]MBA4503302.1 cytochrome c [Marinobacterium marinum]
MKACLLGLALSLSGPLAAADVDTAIQYRQGTFAAMEWQLSRLAAMVQGRVDFDEDEFRQRAGHLVLLGEIVDEGFADAQSARGDQVETRASWRIWSSPDRYAVLMQEMQTQSRELQQAVDGHSGRDKLRPLVGRLAQSCKACHDTFRD